MEADQIHSFSPMNSFTTPLSPISITAQTSSTPTLPPAMFSYHGTPPPTTVDPASTTIKMEEFRSPSLSESPSPSTPSNSSSTGPKPAKKRKSWGQVLPEPKTNLPPRKRAKTEDEKEQRRIERVKRNRLAAHNSRERKRQEVEQLQAEKDKLERDLREAREAMARMAAELNIYRQRHPGEVPESQHNDLNVSLSIEDSEPILQSTICPRQTSFPSPLSMDDMDTPRDYSLSPETPEYNHPQAYESDQTRFPAVSVGFKPCDVPFDDGLPGTLPTPSILDDTNEAFFDFDQFPENTETGLGDGASTSLNTEFLSHDDITNPFSSVHAFGTDHFDLQADSGATYNVSDEFGLAAE